jgi:hypothetical protein
MSHIPREEENKSFTTIEKDHWEKNWEGKVSERPLSLLNVFNRDATTLLAEKLRGTLHPSIVEICFAPGKFLQYLERRFQATCSGYDYSESGCRAARKFLSSCGAKVQVHCQRRLMPRIELVWSTALAWWSTSTIRRG